MKRRDVFVTGATGYIGRALVPALLRRGHRVRILVRPGSEGKAVPGALCVRGNALSAESYRDSISPADTFVHLVGTPHPAPWKGRAFRAVDLPSIEAAANAARYARVQHFVYLSVAYPAPIMAAYIAVRQQGEALLERSGLRTTIVRPWYVLGPGHYWPLLVLPVYRLLETLPATREMALRLGLVRLDQMVGALVHAIENPPASTRAIDVAEMRLFPRSPEAAQP